MYTKLKEEVLKYSKDAFAGKLFAGTSGNLSVFDRENKVMAITPSSVRYETMTVKDIVIVDQDGIKLEGDHKPSSEWKMHLEIFHQLDTVNAVVHTHSPYATSFAVVNKEIPTILIEMVPFLGGDLKVSKYASPGSRELGISVCEVLRNSPASLMQNHGAIAVGEDLSKAYIRAEYIEDAAKIYHHSLQIGKPRTMTEKEIKDWVESWD
ncbi:class II aldolase/adducin family protein [Mycoplasmatota bacterium zrk1]